MSELSFVKMDQCIIDSKLNSEIIQLNIPYSSQYYKEYYGDSFQDHSFLIIYDDLIFAYCICFNIDGKLCFPVEGARIVYLNQIYEGTLTKKQKKHMLNAHYQIIEYLEDIAVKHGCEELIIKDVFNDGILSMLGKALFNKKYHAKVTFQMSIDFDGFNEEIFFTGIRRRSKPHINWGKTNLDVSVISSSNLSDESFLKFKAFHEKISGRQTRSDASWDIQYKMVENGYGELILADFNGNLAAGGLFIDQYDTSTYFTGVFDRDLFEYGISHYILFQGVCNSFTRGRTKAFSFGHFDTDIADPKWYNIQSFKSGFCEDLKPIILWQKKFSKIEQ